MIFSWLRKKVRGTYSKSQNKSLEVLTLELSSSAELKAKSIAHKKMGDEHFDHGTIDAAVTCYREAIICDPAYAEAHNNLSNAYRGKNLFDDAEYHLRQAIKLKPSVANFHYNLATLQLAQSKRVQAIEGFRTALMHHPTHHAARAIMLYLMQQMCSWKEVKSEIDILRRSLSLPIVSAEEVFSPFVFMTLPGTTPEEHKQCAKKWVQFEYQPLIAMSQNHAFDHRRPVGNRINVGYLSGDFRNHAVSSLMAEVFELHDRNQFHITAYSYGPDDGSEMRKRLQSTFDQFVDIRDISDLDVARKIYVDHIDILVDLTGFTENTRTQILALRPAPLQLSYLGYVGTLGADFVDYLITDCFIIPPEHQQHFTEKILYLPHCFQSNDSKRPRPPAPSRASCGLPENAFIFCSFNQTYKISAEVFDVWCRLLNSKPNSVLWLLASTPFAEENLKREAKSRGVDPARLIMAPLLESVQHLARIQCANLFLDTTPINAGTTCSDSLWMGLPLITCAGEMSSSRIAGSLLSAMDMPELITYSLEEYYRVALELATNESKLEAIRHKICANRETSILFDSGRFTYSLENLYLRIIRHPKIGGGYVVAN